jgi:hypothetical protein
MIEHPDDYKDVDIPALCEKLNCDLIVGDESTLLLDLDNDHALNEFQRVRPVVEQVYPFKSVERYPSRNGNGEHVIIKLVSPVMDTIERLLLQAALGSDGKREVLSRYRVARGHLTPSVLFKPRTKVATSECSKPARLNPNDYGAPFG